MAETSFICRTAANQDTEKIVSLAKRISTESDLLCSPETSEHDLQDIEGTYMKQDGIFEVIENELGKPDRKVKKETCG